MTEQTLRKQVQVAVSRLGARLFRVNTGKAWAGKARPDACGGVYIPDAYPVRMGFANGGSDLIGWTPIVITPQMVGRTMAVFTAVELKTGSTALSREQAVFLDAVRRAGGLAGVARSVEDAVRLLAGEGDSTTAPLPRDTAIRRSRTPR